MNKCDINTGILNSQANCAAILDIPFHVGDFDALAEANGGDECAYLLIHLQASCKTSWFKKKRQKFIARIRNDLSEEVLLPRKRLDHNLRMLSSISRISVSNHYFKNVRQTHIFVHDFKEPYFVLGVIKQAIRKFGSLKKALFYFRTIYKIQHSSIEIDGVKYMTSTREEFAELAKVCPTSLDAIMDEFLKMGVLSRKMAVWNKKLQWHYTIPESGKDLFWEKDSQETYPQPNIQKQSRRPLKLATCYNIVNKEKGKKDNTAPNAVVLANAKDKSLWEWRSWNTQKLMEKIHENKKYISNPTEQMKWSIFSIQKRIRERKISFNHALNIEMKIIRSGKYGIPRNFDDREIANNTSRNNTVIYNAKATDLIEKVSNCHRLNSVGVSGREEVLINVSEDKPERMASAEIRKEDLLKKPVNKLAELKGRMETYQEKMHAERDPVRKAAYSTMVVKIQSQMSDLGKRY